jgi:hypothetical protein
MGVGHGVSWTKRRCIGQGKIQIIQESTDAIFDLSSYEIPSVIEET